MTNLLLTRDEAAALANVDPEVVKSWHKRGILRPAARSRARGKPFLYDPRDVIHAERTTRRNDPTRRRQRRLALEAHRGP